MSFFRVERGVVVRELVRGGGSQASIWLLRQTRDVYKMCIIYPTTIEESRGAESSVRMCFGVCVDPLTTRRRCSPRAVV